MTAEQRAAALTVCAYARDTAEARALLLMLGLADEETVAASARADEQADWWRELVAAGYARPVAS